MTDPFVLGVVGSIAAGMMTGVGALPIFFFKTISVRVQDTLLGSAAGVMLAASFFSLIIPALAVSEGLYGSGAAPALIAVMGVLIGAGFIAAINEHVPHQHFVLGKEGPVTDSLRRIWLFIIAIAIHNFPEGLAVGVGFGGGDVAQGTTLAIGIGLQNAPEGLAVAFALVAEGYRRRMAFFVALLTGLVEPIGGLIGAAAVSISQPVLPWALTFAAGAMIYVISHEIIPETHRRNHANSATTGLLCGLVVMMFLDVWLA
jgi:ZIP family zinc transporter